MSRLLSAATVSLVIVALVAWQSLLTGHAGHDSNPPLRDTASLSQDGPQVAAGEIVVRFNDDAPAAAIQSLNASLGARTVSVRPRAGLHRLVLSRDANVTQVLTAYRNHPLVAEAGPSHIARVVGAPNDTNYSYQWHMHDTVGGIWAESAWSVSANKGQGVVVAVIDTGVAYEDFTGPGGLSVQAFTQAPDLAQKTFVAPYDFYNDDEHANDDNGHGTHVTGTLAQDTNNAYGVAGVASNATIMPVKVLAWDGSGPDAGVVEGIYYAVDNGADVINLSLAFPGTGTPDASGAYCTEVVGLAAALDYAHANGVVVVAASGNSATTVACPAAYPTVIAVGATRFDGQAAPYSNSGATLDITGPGGDPNLDQNGDGFSDGVVQETYCYDYFTLLIIGTYDLFCDIFMSGTSMASPHVAGAAALLLGEDPSLTPDDVRFYLTSTARDRGAAGWDPTYGAGVLDAYNALTALTDVSPTPTSPATETPTSTATATPTPTSTPTGPSGLPDLAQTSVSDPPSRKKVGSNIRITDTVENTGDSTASTSWTRFYLSIDTQWDPADVALSGSRAVPELIPGASSTATTRVGIPTDTPVAEYYVLVCADDTSLIDERDETNNCLASTTTMKVTAAGGGGGGNRGGHGPNR